MKLNLTLTEEEKKRILNLHEVAVKKQFGIVEQTSAEQQSSESWQLCNSIITKSGDEYFFQIKKNQSPISIPKISELGAVITDGNPNSNEPTRRGLIAAKELRQGGGRCQLGSSVSGAMGIIYFDDVKYMKPFYAYISFRGELKSERLNPETQKVRRAKEIIFRKVRTEDFVVELVNQLGGERGMEGGYERPPDTPDLPPKTPEKFKIDLVSPFKFDSTDLTPAGQAEFDKQVNEAVKIYGGFKIPMKVVVTTSASIDRNPNGKMENGMIRKDYNMDLSKRRAEAIIKILKEKFGNTKLQFVPNPIGETSKFAPFKWEEDPSDKTGEGKIPNPKDTEPNRRLIITFPTIERNF